MSSNSNDAVEVAEEAIEQKLENLNIGRRRHLPTAERVRIWEEEQKNKILIQKGLKGTVKWYSVLGRYGFITRADGEKDVFVHQTAISKSATNKFYLRTLCDNEEVVFDLVQGKKGPEAANVSGPDGENVVGSRFRHLLLSRFRKFRGSRRTTSGDPQDSEEKTAEPKKQKRQRKPRQRKAGLENGNGEAMDKQANVEINKNAAPQKVIEEATKIERCGSALGEATLGAQAVDAQI